MRSERRGLPILFSIFTHICRLTFILFSIFCASVYGQPSSGLVAKYTFNNGDYIDEAGHNNAKAAGTSLVDDRFGNRASACFLNGNYGSFINLGSSSVLKPVKGSISMWVKIEYLKVSGTGVEATPFILTKNGQQDDFYEAYWIGYGWKTQKVSANMTLDETNQVSILSIDTFAILKWHHVVLTYDDDFMSFYVDNMLQNKMPKNFRSIFQATDSVMIGHTANKKNNRFLLGKVDDILIYNRVITETEVDELFNAPNPNRYAIYYTWLYRCLALLGILLAIGFWIRMKYRNAILKEQSKNRISARLNELETKALRAQMNPHFLFNSLATLDGLILAENTTDAHQYLTRFSQLVRKLLESSVSDSITLADEIDILEKYVNLEMMRFESGFDFEIKCEVGDPKRTHIPFMLVQPFVENAIWHGLAPKKDERILNISFKEHDVKSILCVVTDNGVGRAHITEQKNPLKKKSLAIEFISQRLDILAKSTGINCFVNIIDNKDDLSISFGTTVEIVIPVMNHL